MKYFFRVAVLTLWMVGMVLSAMAAVDFLPPDKFTDLALKVLTYDRTLEGRVKDQIVIGIIYAGSSADLAEQLSKAFELRSDKTVGGFSFKAELVPWQDRQSFKNSMRDHSFDCLIVLHGLGNDVQAVSSLAREYQVLTITNNRGYVGSLSLGIVLEDGRIKIYRSDESLKAENVELGSELLKITRAD